MSRLALRRGTVVSVDRDGPVAELVVEVGAERRPAIAYTALTGPTRPGDDVVVNVAARDLGLGSGGFDVLHANLTQGLDGAGEPGAHVMKLNYTSLQHAVEPVEERAGEPGGRLGRPVAVIALHGQLAPVAWAAGRAAQGARIGFVQTAGGALAGELSETVRELRERELLAGHVTAAPCHGGEEEAMTVAGALHAGLAVLGWDAAIAGPGPGIVGSDTALGHGGLAALDTAHAALALGCPTVVVPRMSSGDPRPRHRGLSHHTTGVLDMLLGAAIVALPTGEDPRELGEEARAAVERHDRRTAEAPLEAYRLSGLPAHTMGRDIDEDALFFRAALAGGAVLGEEIHGV
jgi:hypothetical protein